MGRCPQSGSRPQVDGPASPDRRRALLLLGAAVGGVTAGGTGFLIGCTPADNTASSPPGGSTRVPLSALPPGTHLRVLHQGFPVDVRRREDGSVDALSLLCTHTACEVKWQPATERYSCSCHEGLFDADGEVLLGPPPRPLRSVPARIDGEEVVLGEEPVDPPTS